MSIEEQNLIDQCTTAYNEYQHALSEDRPEDVMKDFPIMERFEGDISSLAEVRAYLLQQAPGRRRAGLRRRFDVIDKVKKHCWGEGIRERFGVCWCFDKKKI